MLTSTFNKLYDYLNNESKDRVCKGITDEACDHVAKNFFAILFTHTFTKLGDTLSNPKTVLTWLMNYVNAPVFLISLIVPIRESGALIPQVAISNYVKTKPIRKYIWIAGSIIQGLAIAGIGLVALHFDKQVAGYLIILCLVIFSLARSLASVSSKDIKGKAIPKTRRGKLGGYTSSFSGILVLIAGLYITYTSKTTENIQFYTNLIFFAASMWIIASFIYASIKEFPSSINKDDNERKGIIDNFKLLKEDTHLRDFVIARSLLLCSALSAPFYVTAAQTNVKDTSYLLGLLIISNGLASIVSSPYWGKMADKSSKNTMAYAVTIASICGLMLFFIISFGNDLKTQLWLYPIAFFILGIAHSGVRQGRKTYVIDMSTGDDRTNYVSVSNTIIGLILLVTGGISALLSLISVESVILALSIIGLLGAVKSYKLRNVEKSTEDDE